MLKIFKRIKKYAKSSWLQIISTDDIFIHFPRKLFVKDVAEIISSNFNIYFILILQRLYITF